MKIGETTESILERIGELVAESEAAPDGVAWSAWARDEARRAIAAILADAYAASPAGQLRQALRQVVRQSLDRESAAIAARALGERGPWMPRLIHDWFELTYAEYLTIPRSVLQSMPDAWQARFVACLEELDDAIDWRPAEGRYWVELRDGLGRYRADPLRDYQRGRRHIPLRREPAPPIPVPADLSAALAAGEILESLGIPGDLLRDAEG